MTTTGYSPDRALSHDALIDGLIAVLEVRGYQPQELPVDGDRPDIKIRDRHRYAYVDVKTRTQGYENYTVKVKALAEYHRLTVVQKTPVYVVWDNARVDDVFTLVARIVGGPHRHSGAGSNTDYVLVAPGGTPFNEWFPPLG